MRKVVISLGDEDSFEICEYPCGLIDVIMVEYNHPNSGLNPWFFLWRSTFLKNCANWTFVQVSTADEKHIKKTLSGIKTKTSLDEWLEWEE